MVTATSTTWSLCGWWGARGENSRWIILLLLPSTNLFKEVEEKYLEELKTFAITNSSGVQIRSIILYGDLVRPSCELGNMTNGGPTHKLCNISHIWILHFPIISSQKGTVVVTTYLSLINHTYHHYTMLQYLFISSLCPILFETCIDSGLCENLCLNTRFKFLWK